MATANKKRPKRSLVPTYCLVGLGILLIAIGLSWKQFVPTSTFWNAEDAKALAELQAAAHAESISLNSSHRMPGMSLPEQHPTQEPISARLQYESKQLELERAQRMHNRWGYCFTGIGALASFSGLLISRSFT